MFTPTDVNTYLSSIESKLATTYASEQSYSSDLEKLVTSIDDDIKAIPQPKNIDCGIPDYAVLRSEMPFGYIETKDIGSDLSSKKYNEQFSRYRNSLDNLIITNYLEFRLYRYGNFIEEVKIGEKVANKVLHFPKRFNIFQKLIDDFYVHRGAFIKSIEKLSSIMAEKAKVFEMVIEAALKNNSLKNQDKLRNHFNVFKKTLTGCITERDFAHQYAQTITMGMFVAFMNNPENKFISRYQIADFISKKSPFLRNLLGYITRGDIDENIKFGVDWLLEFFNNVDFKIIRKQFKCVGKGNPMLFIYDHFIATYDPFLKKQRGIFYTPEPIVKFIVNAVDDVLKTTFHFENGLGEYSKIQKENQDSYHKVQILDPALGTGSFLNEVIRNIYSKFKRQQGMWSNYVERHLIPRLNGFELFMAPYTLLESTEFFSLIDRV